VVAIGEHGVAVAQRRQRGACQHAAQQAEPFHHPLRRHRVGLDEGRIDERVQGRIPAGIIRSLNLSIPEEVFDADVDLEGGVRAAAGHRPHGRRMRWRS
jgi:hypothetical protein